MSKADEIEEAIKILEYDKKQHEEELKIELEDRIDEPRIAYLASRIQAIETVLSELKKKNHTENTLRYQIERLYKSRGEYEKARGVRLEHKTEYISKDKIKEKIEEIKNSNENYTFEKLTSEDIRRTVITNLQELLEKEK